MFKRGLWILEYGFLLFGGLVAYALPLKLLRPGGRVLGRLLHAAARSRRKIALKNTRLVYGHERPELVRRSFESIGITILEMLRILLGRRDLLETTVIEGLENVFRARACGRPTMVITGHLGNWELFANAAALQGCLNSLVARPLDNPYLNGLLERLRKKYGNSVIYKKGALKLVLRSLTSFLNVVIMIDQGVRRPEGVITDFLGRKAYTTRMPALLALKTGAAVFPGTIRRTPKGHIALIGPQLPLVRTGNSETDVTLNTALYARMLEERVAACPEEWLWIHKRWKRIPENEAVW